MAVSLVVAGTLALTGCSNDPGDETPTQAPTSEPGATTETAPTTEAPADDDTETTTAPPLMSAEEQDEAHVEETLQLYTRALDDAFNGDASVEGIYPFTRDTAREQWVTEVMGSEAQGITSSGVTELEVLEVSIDGDTAEAVACADVSAVEAFNENGESIIAEDRLDRTLQDYVLERDESAELGWYVVEDTNRNEPCDG
ncbi:MAG: hypothetical protein M3520_03110 [Actinomycetota bacterium]|nr:hypothetical protein [Actinomycetota bacterium]